MNNKHSFTGKKIDPPNISPNMSISDLISFYGSTGFNARRLSEAAKMLKKMIDTDATICLTISGAMTPIGLGKCVSTLIEKGFIDWIVTTGANAYHDLHFAYDLPVRQGHFDVDDDILYSKQIVRIYDVFIKEVETLQRQDDLIQDTLRKRSKRIVNPVKEFSTSDLSYLLGENAYHHSPFPDKSFMVSAFKNEVPIYIPSLTDSSIGMNMIPLLFESSLLPINLFSDISESAAILWKSKVSGGIELGGGVPKNFFQQTGPTLYQILKIKERGHDYVIQLTDARPDTGGLSGATIQEGKSWGKIKTSHAGNVIVYGDSSVYFPLLCSYVLSECKPRKQKRLYHLKDKFVNEMKDNYLKKIKK
ncbi:MAG TPA: deoxyhypusine synthase [Nitrososphaeraceae archaeon]|nr:deoxyhypusine synthase [Nitrososphaeraceae archaeon]